uniref:Uncharacterized protein n=1 Tax=Eutreptiella gymnastica TaxID=73025 RepID=A0A7S1I1Y9_9EUGL|mmetsp:Transcript_122841/g.213066  ORF Transcript_122841/g.213066 Transcript_122841/m.213066 type:complete len:107 (+) Transcript_122841:63-383(+)
MAALSSPRYVRFGSMKKRIEQQKIKHGLECGLAAWGCSPHVMYEYAGPQLGVVGLLRPQTAECFSRFFYTRLKHTSKWGTWFAKATENERSCKSTMEWPGQANDKR